MVQQNMVLRGILVLLLGRLALAGPMIANKMPPNRGTEYVRYPKPSKPNYSKGTGTYYYTTPGPSYKTETPEYYTTQKQYSTTPKQSYSIKTSSSSPSPYQPSTRTPTYYPPTKAQSTPSYTRQPSFYTTTAAPMYYKEEAYQTQPFAYYPSTEAQSYYQASYVRETTEVLSYSRPVEPYKFNQISNTMPSIYSLSTEANYNRPYTTTPPAPIAYYEQATYSSEAPVYYTQGEESQYAVPPGHPATHEDYHQPQRTEYDPETHHKSYVTGHQTYYTDSQKYVDEETEYYPASGYYTTVGPPEYYSAPAEEYYPTTTPNYYGINQY